MPRTAWGVPDLRAAWTNATMTPLQRPADLADKEFLTSEEPSVRRWLGDSRGHWDGDTLIIETTNFTDKILGRGGTVFGGDEHLHVIERFTRISGTAIDYKIKVIDPTVWTEPWTVSVPMTALAVEGGVFEHACHEGNYALPNILSGARAGEREASN